MNSITLLGIETILCFAVMLVLYKKYKLEGIYAYSIIALILSCLMSLKTITIFEFDINLGIIPNVTVFIASNILIQKKGIEEGKRFLLVVIFTAVISYLMMYLVSYMNASDINLFTSASYNNIFLGSERIYFSNIATMLYGLLLNNQLYHYLKKMQNNILISSLFSTIIIQFLTAVLFSLITYIFAKEIIDIIKIIMIRYLTSLIVGLLGTIVIYISKYINEK